MRSHPVRDDQDPGIARLFAEQDRSLPPDDFMIKLGKRIDARQRVQHARRVLAIIACLVVATLAAPWLAQLMAAVVDLASLGVGNLGALYYAPITWLVVGSIVAACSPVIYLWRTGRW
jgi:hypothetical protein